MHDITSDHITVVFFCICRHEDKKKKRKKNIYEHTGRKNLRTQNTLGHKIFNKVLSLIWYVTHTHTHI